MRHGDVAHVVDIREVGSALTSLVRSNVRDEQVACVQVVRYAGLVEQADGRRSLSMVTLWSSSGLCLRHLCLH